MEVRHRTGPLRAGRPMLLAAALATAGSLTLGATAGAASASSQVRSGHAAGAMVREAKVGKLGTVLVTATGFTLYRFTPDKVNKVACTGVCASIWPPLLLPAGTHKATGMTGLSTVKDPNGKLQVTYRGHPLYTYVGDKKAGVANGQGYGGQWYAVTASVAPLAASASASTGGSSGSSTSWS